MPWTGKEFKDRHDHSLSSAQASHASRIANAILRRTGDEGMAIATAIARSKGRASGGPAPQVAPVATAAPNVNAAGYVPVPQAGNVTLDLNTGAMTPGSQQAIQTLAQRGLPITGTAAGAQASQAAQNQAIMQALQAGYNPFQPGIGGGGAGGNEGGGRVLPLRAAGGMAPMSMATPWWTRRQSSEEDRPVGLLQGTTGGKADAISMALEPHSHVIPASVVSGLGGGNTTAGALKIQSMMSGGPFGTALPHAPRGGQRMGLPHIGSGMPRLAKGGARVGGIPTKVSDGEYIIAPEDVLRKGGGDYEKGHDWIDRFIIKAHRQMLATEAKYKGPVRD